MGLRLNVALLTVNRRISQEAREALLKVNTIVVHRKPKDSLYRYKNLDQVRSVLFDPPLQGDQVLDSSPHALDNLVKHLLQTHPKLQSVAISEESLPGAHTVREFVDSSSLCRDFKCVDLGLFEVQPLKDIGCKVWIQHTTLSRLLYRSRRLLSRNVTALLARWRDIRYRGRFGAPLSERAIFFTLWLRVFELLAEADLWPEAVDQRARQELAKLHTFATCCELERFAQKMPTSARPPTKHVKLSKVNAEESSSETLEWASEIMGKGITELRAKRLV